MANPQAWKNFDLIIKSPASGNPIVPRNLGAEVSKKRAPLPVGHPDAMALLTKP